MDEWEEKVVELLSSIFEVVKSINTKLGEQGAQPVPKKLPKSTKKFDAEQLSRVYNFMGATGPYICKKCKGLISWDLLGEGRKLPLHVDGNGHIMGNGLCPEYKKREGD